MPTVNLLAVLLCGVSSMVLGAIWYAPPVFGKRWQTAARVSDDEIKTGHPGVVYGGAFVLSLIAAYVFAMFIGPDPELGFALGAGFSAGLCWVAASFGINYLFERKTFALWAINGLYHTFQFGLFGLILALMG